MNKTFGQSIIAQESLALAHLEKYFPDTFDCIVEDILQLSGKVICTGIGKSAHVARKIAATMASTGTPAFFVHATEGMHGDLGMITPNDAVLALSWSGNTKEILDLIKHSTAQTKIALTAKAHSPMAHLSDSVLILPEYPEACPLGLAPSVSTTMMMALGDALAFTVLQKRGFQKEDFARFHPGGSLGKSLQTMDQVMHCNVPFAYIEDTPDTVMTLMVRHGQKCVVIKNDHDDILGILNIDHIPALLRKEKMQNMIQKFTLKVKTTERVQDVIKKMQDNNQDIVLVYDKNKEKVLGLWHHPIQAKESTLSS